MVLTVKYTFCYLSKPLFYIQMSPVCRAVFCFSFTISAQIYDKVATVSGVKPQPVMALPNGVSDETAYTILLDARRCDTMLNGTMDINSYHIT